MKRFPLKTISALASIVTLLVASTYFMMPLSVNAAGTTITYHADGTPNDVSGTHNGTWVGPPAYVPGYTGASGDLAFAIGAMPSYIETDAAVGTFGTDPATIDFWFNSQGTKKTRLNPVMSARSFCGNPSEGWFDIRVGTSLASNNPPGTLIVEFGDGTNYVNVIGQTDVMDNQWHHIVVTRGSTGVSINVDGALDGSGASAPANINPSVPYTIFRSPCVGQDGTQDPAAFDSIDEINITRGTSGVGPPTNKNQCKNHGWATFTIPRAFKNQGDCIQFVNTGK